MRALAFLLSLSAHLAVAQPPADIIVRADRIYAIDAQPPPATAMAIRAGKIVAIGADQDMASLHGPETKTLSFAGRTILPGLIDAHGHMSGLGSYGFGLLDLSSAKSFDDVVTAVAEKAKTARRGEWILGGRWDHESWPEKKLPTHEKLTAAAPENPVWLRRVDGHAAIANALAMKIAGIGPDAQSPPGGEIVRDERGTLTGVFVDNGMDPIAVRAGGATRGAADLILKAQEMCLSAGLTSVHDAGVSPVEIAAYRELERDGRLKLRIHAMVAGQHAKDWFAKNPPATGERLSIRACKLYMDGAMGSRGAWLLEPYADRPTGSDGKPWVGLSVMTPEFVREIALDGAKRGYQVCTHAIGDRANREVLDAYEAALKELDPAKRSAARFRIEHAQLLAPQDIPRFAALGVIASMQPTHCTSDMRWVESRVGPQRADGAYAWAAMLKSGARIAAGSDFPVESHNPMLGLYAAITRQDADGKPTGGWRPEQRMTRDQALRAFTVDAAFAAFRENDIGSLAVGKWADFVVLDRDSLTCPEVDIIATKVIATVIAGEVVYHAPD
jgi:predicted amidohydrolase YtcJ